MLEAKKLQPQPQSLLRFQKINQMVFFAEIMAETFMDMGTVGCTFQARGPTRR